MFLTFDECNQYLDWVGLNFKYEQGKGWINISSGEVFTPDDILDLYVHEVGSVENLNKLNGN